MCAQNKPTVPKVFLEFSLAKVELKSIQQNIGRKQDSVLFGQPASHWVPFNLLARASNLLADGVPRVGVRSAVPLHGES